MAKNITKTNNSKYIATPSKLMGEKPQPWSLLAKPFLFLNQGFGIFFKA